jgi:hypothetical protein
MADIFEEIGNWISGLFSNAPEVDHRHLVEGEIGKGLKNKVTRRVNYVLAEHGDRTYKIGKTGQPDLRVEYEDYSSSSYKKMYLLYQSDKKEHISHMEEYYIKLYKKKHPHRSDNIQMYSGGGMRSFDGKYHLYVII